MCQFYLASKSPRRSQILKDIGYTRFEVLSDNTPATAFAGDEVREEGEAPINYVTRIVQEKIERAAKRIKAENLKKLPILAADTIVIPGEDIFGKEILGKPANRDEERQFLRRLSGKTHIVLTAALLTRKEKEFARALSVSFVTFKQLSEKEIEWYSATEEPYDKAGGYAIQGLAAPFIEKIEGSYTGIMGLAAYETAAILESFGIYRDNFSPEKNEPVEST